MKDWIVSKTISLGWSLALSKKYGNMIHLKIDSQNKKVVAELMLKGETSPIDVRADYKLVEEPGGLFIELQNFECGSREWLTALLNEPLLQSQLRFKIPFEKFAKFCL
jgi:hypothetical protein